MAREPPWSRPNRRFKDVDHGRLTLDIESAAGNVVDLVEAVSMKI
jgi:hypothetical protein